VVIGNEKRREIKVKVSLWLAVKMVVPLIRVVHFRKRSRFKKKRQRIFNPT